MIEQPDRPFRSFAALPAWAAVLGLGAAIRAQADWHVAPDLTSRHTSAAAVDAARGLTVLFGGQDGEPRGDTWTWDGTAWSPRTPLHSPPARYLHAMVYDPPRQRVLLYGGQNSAPVPNELWAWDGSDWQVVPTAHDPGVRTDFTLVHDPARDRVVLFGGRFGPSLGDLWEFDGSDWTNVAVVPASWPPNDPSPALVYDEVTARTLLFHFDPLNLVVWSWNGVAWTSQTGPGFLGYPGAKVVADTVAHRLLLVPGGRFNGLPSLLRAWAPASRTWQPLGGLAPESDRPAVAFDAARNRLVLRQGAVAGIGDASGTWEWDGSQWLSLAPALPCWRTGHQLAYDARHDRVVLHGGQGVAQLADTWVRDGGVWRAAAPTPEPGNSTQPAFSHGFRLVYDEARDQVLYIGGDAVTPFPFWRWATDRWQPIAAGTLPSPRMEHALAYDQLRQRVLLFGGHENTGNDLADTWSWNGTVWTQLAPAGAPPPRRGHDIAYDVPRDRVVLVGGQVRAGNLNDTWEFDGADWHLRLPSQPLPSSLTTRLAFDRQRQCVVALVPLTNGTAIGTWDWTGDDWQFVPVATPPSARTAEALVGTDAGLLLLGGQGQPSPMPIAAQLLLRTEQPAALLPFGSSGASSAGPLLLAGDGRLPWVGDAFGMRMSPLPFFALPCLWLGTQRSSWLGLPLPVDLGVAGFPGQLAWIAPEGPWPIARDASGDAVATIPVPAAPALAGTALYAQGFVYEPATAALATSNALTMVLGIR